MNAGASKYCNNSILKLGSQGIEEEWDGWNNERKEGREERLKQLSPAYEQTYTFS
jgi:hypothetical protein